MNAKKALLVVGFLAVLAVGLLAGRQLAMMGSTDSPGTSPGTTTSYTLDDIYSRLATGTMPAPSTFSEPPGGPTSGTMHTLDEIMALIPQYEDNGDGTVTDRHSGLMWTKNANPKGGTSNWDDADSYCDNLALAGYSDWRIPTVGELTTHASDTRRSPILRDGHPFENIADVYWTHPSVLEPVYAGQEVAYVWSPGTGEVGRFISITGELMTVWPVRGP